MKKSVSLFLCAVLALSILATFTFKGNAMPGNYCHIQDYDCKYMWDPQSWCQGWGICWGSVMFDSNYCEAGFYCDNDPGSGFWDYYDCNCGYY